MSLWHDIKGTRTHNHARDNRNNVINHIFPGRSIPWGHTRGAEVCVVVASMHDLRQYTDSEFQEGSQNYKFRSRLVYRFTSYDESRMLKNNIVQLDAAMLAAPLDRIPSH